MLGAPPSRENIDQHFSLFGTEGTSVVAVKTLKENANEKERSDLVQELQVMKMLEPHPNVVRLLGCCTEKDPLFVIMEFVPHGKLQSFLRSSRAERFYGNLHGPSNTLTSRDLTTFVYQVARGMEFLSAKGSETEHNDEDNNDITYDDIDLVDLITVDPSEVGFVELESTTNQEATSVLVPPNQTNIHTSSMLSRPAQSPLPSTSAVLNSAESPIHPANDKLRGCIRVRRREVPSPPPDNQTNIDCLQLASHAPTSNHRVTRSLASQYQDKGFSI
uniref:Protein kinase domain-containing protein n=1 Tax=Timema tahoe TaxID=61484 RepID=A0A7R9IS78_9NEOP|nr:unnamed protein product [Timema tahoe]